MIPLRVARPFGLGERSVIYRKSEALSLAFLFPKKTFNKCATTRVYAFKLALSVMYTGTF